MRIDRLAVAGCALVASTILISCGSDNNSTPANGSLGTGGVQTTLGTSNSLGTDTSLGGGGSGSTGTSTALGSAGSTGTTTP